jgi:hypothetical protein
MADLVFSPTPKLHKACMLLQGWHSIIPAHSVNLNPTVLRKVLSWFLIDHVSSRAAVWYLSATDSKQSASKESVEDLVSKIVKFGERGG